MSSRQQRQDHSAWGQPEHRQRPPWRLSLPIRPIEYPPFHGALVTQQTLNLLAKALGIQWPGWYRTLVLELITPPLEGQPYYLPGGVFFASLEDVFRETCAFRSGQRCFSGAPSWKQSGPKWTDLPWPHEYVVVGTTGQGPAVLNTDDESALILLISHEGYFEPPLIDLCALRKTPVELARMMKQSRTR